MEATEQLALLDSLRREVSSHLDSKTRSELGQYMTPSSIARFMASLFSTDVLPESLLDAGAGVGSLTAAFLERFPGTFVEAWEVDSLLGEHLAETLSRQRVIIHNSDFVEDSTWNLLWGLDTRFTHAVLNPPYRKINSQSRHRTLLRGVGIETVNLYSAFVWLTILLMRDRGEIVAIVPRSFCNGTYYRPFREALLTRCGIAHIHVFQARNKAFQDDDVLQENIIIKLVAGQPQKSVVVSESHDARFGDYRETIVDFEKIVEPNDRQKYIRIPLVREGEKANSPLFSFKMNDIGLEVSTGPVVDFRLRNHCRSTLAEGMAPLLYAHHFSAGGFTYPKAHKKPGAILINDETRRWLMPSGYYVVTRRFSSKEERKRVVAHVFDPKELPCEMVGFENHLNVFHKDKDGLDQETAYGLALFLNSSVVDSHFRQFSGHTQVNATDLRQMRYPSSEQLRQFGRVAAVETLTQNRIDEIIDRAELNHGNE